VIGSHRNTPGLRHQHNLWHKTTRVNGAFEADFHIVSQISCTLMELGLL
jgi:hypothetical protein